EHYFRAAHTRLLDMGLAPHLLNETLIDSLFAVADRYKSRVNLHAIRPTVRWRSTSNELAGRP
ncbi:MAG: NAD-dependent dehydratase, partial [Actinobacteria bacterium]|nr:NAD-dependent dehydratase [Actinomycetota bacterium]